MFNRTSPTEVRGNAGWRVENGQHLSVNLPPVTVEVLRARLDAEASQTYVASGDRRPLP